MRRFLLVALALGGCATVDRQFMANDSRFTPTADGFVFQTVASASWQEDNADAERMRLSVLQSFLSRNQTCPSGHDIISRQVVRRPATMLGVKTGADIVYTGRCR